MSGVPPIPPPGNGPPGGYAAYPRAQSTYGSVAALRLVSEGYFGLSRVFLINVVLSLVARVAGAAGTDRNQALLYLGVYALFMLVVVAALTFPQNKKIGEGCGWNPGMPLLASILMGVNSALCCGVVGYVIVQQIASQEMKRYGITGGFFGIKKKDVEAKIAQLVL